MRQEVAGLSLSSFSLAGPDQVGDVVFVKASGAKILSIPVLSLLPGDSPRLEGEDKAHIARLLETEGPLPPILVDRSCMRVIDGMHRLIAASLRGQETIEVEFFEGSTADAFLRAVEENVTHGLPLSQADRRAAAERIIASHPHLSDRAIAQVVGLGARTVAGIRSRATDGEPQVNARVGRDGRVRPLDAAEGRRKAAKLIAEQPQASLREVARRSGVSLGTARDVRERLERGEEPIPARQGANRHAPSAKSGQAEGPGEPAAPQSTASVLEKLLRDPSLRHTERGRWLLRWLQHGAVGPEDWSAVVTAVPPHCAVLVGRLARQYAEMWLNFAHKLDERARVTDPWARTNGDSRSRNTTAAQAPKAGHDGVSARPNS